MNPALFKWIQTIKISWSKYTAYRLGFFLQVIGPTLVFFFIKYNLWSSIFEQSGESTTIMGYSLSTMIQYHALTLIVGLLSQGHTALNLAEEIRMGRISTYLIYPFNFWEFHTASFISFQLLQALISAITFLVFLGLGFYSLPETSILIQAFFYCQFVSVFWFIVQFFTGLLGFWLEETWIIRVLLHMITAFLSGAIIPLDLYPEWSMAILKWTPFPYITYLPVKLLMGESINLSFGMSILTIWIAIFYLLNKYAWRKGIKLYTAAGM